MPNRAREESHTSGLALEASSIGSTSCLGPQDVACWATSIPSPETQNIYLHPSPWFDCSGSVQPADDTCSASSSMVDSAYASLPGAPRRSSEQGLDPSLNFTTMFSPSVSAVSYTNHADGGNFMLPSSAAGSFSGNLEGMELASQASLWTGNVSAAPTPVSLDFTQSASTTASRRFMPQEAPSINLVPTTFMPSQSPDIISQSAGLSRTSSRATTSGYTSGPSSSKTVHGQFSGHTANAYTAPHMTRQPSGNLTGAQYLNGSAVMSPASSILTMEQPAPVAAHQTLMTEEWHDWFNADGNENEESAIRTSAEDSMKFEGSGSEHRRASIEDENARSHPLYNVDADKNGEYHCPYTKTEDCGHEPVRLKCNYDKYIDSHLRPFRCKVAGCEDQPFSSTACLLRHQREAHAMHGHGHKPNLCLWQDCERSKAGNGFPRRYNLLDHMKRVHGYSGNLVEEPASGAARRAVSGQGRTKGGRVEKTQRKPTKAELEQQARAKKAKEVQQIKARFSRCKQTMVQQLNTWEALEDQSALAQLKENLANIEKMQQSLIELG